MNLGAHPFRDLHGIGAHTARSAVDEDFVSRLDAAGIAQRLQRRYGSYGYCCGLFERDIVGLVDHGPVLVLQDILAERTRRATEHGIAGSEPGYIFANGLDHACEIHPEAWLPGRTNARTQTHDVRGPAHVMPVEWIDRGCLDLDQQLVPDRRRYLQVFQCKDVGRAVAAMHDRLHGRRVDCDNRRCLAGRIVAENDSQGDDGGRKDAEYSKSDLVA